MSRSRRSRRAGLVLLAGVTACAAVLAAPAPTPRGQVLDLVGAPEPAAGVVAAPATPVSPTHAPASASSPAPATSTTPAAAGAQVQPSDPTMVDAPGPTAPPIQALEGYTWPIARPRLTLPFGPSPWGSRLVDGEWFHDGIDLATFCGDRVRAAHAGTVLAAGRQFDDHVGWIGDLGPYYRRLDRKGLWSTLPIAVVVDDGNGYRSIYAHFSRVVVREGQEVEAGQLLGYEGATGRASGCHLHYGLFSPLERDTMAIRPDVVKRMKVPSREIARVDPLLVLPPKKGIPRPSTAP